MTVIAATVEESSRTAYIGADSGAWRDDRKLIYPAGAAKTLRLPILVSQASPLAPIGSRRVDLLLAFAGSHALRQTLARRWTKREAFRIGINEYDGAEEVLGRVLDRIAEIFGEEPKPFTWLDGHDRMDAALIVAYEGKIYNVASDFSFSSQDVPFDAIGMGGDVALGALAALWNPEGADGSGSWLTGSAYSALGTALRVAERHSDGVCGPFTRHWAQAVGIHDVMADIADG